MYRYKYLLVNAIVSAKQNSSRSTLRLKRLSHNKMKWNIYIYIYIFSINILLHIHLSNIKTLALGANILGVPGKNIKINY